MPESDPPTRAALYVDFDNVFLALLDWDERAAYAFGERPDVWLAWLEGRQEGGPPTTRRTLVRRCYLNPGGYCDFDARDAVARYRAARSLRPRVYFSEFRAAFVQAGFDVVDCPPVTSLKNTADMRMALDIREALDHRTAFDEFVLLSGDSDFLPALARLRAHDRRITILAQRNAKRAYLAAADVVFALDEFVGESLRDHPVAQAQPGIQSLSQHAGHPPAARIAAPQNGLREAALAWLRKALASSPDGALRMTQVGSRLLQELPALRGNYAGAGTLRALVEEARDARLSLSGPPDRLWLYDAERTAPPGDLPPGVEEQSEAGEPTLPEEEDRPAVEAVEPSAGNEASEAVAPPPVIVAPPMPEPALLAETAAPPSAPATPPQPAPAVAEVQSPPSEQRMAEAAQLVRDMLWGLRDAKHLPVDLPAFSPAEIGFVLDAILRHQPFGMPNASGVAATIAAEAASHGLHVSAREVTAIFRCLMRNRWRLDDWPPDDASDRIAEALYDSLLHSVSRVREQLTQAEQDALRAWCHAGVKAG
ncbi:MAG TPA: NYN domain-containing protein [Acetobacteraceae bacterium]|nr:NYN domain-containing protein [Acetobacteraceae bacterium]